MKMDDLFQGFNPSQYNDEARRQWGKSEAFGESEKRTERYAPDDWKALGAEQAAIYADAYVALKAGTTPSDAAVMAIAERHRMSIDRWFYPCSHTMHRGLTSMYDGDHRFRQSIDRHGEGLASFLAEAIRAKRGPPRGLNERRARIREMARLPPETDVLLATNVPTALLRQATSHPHRSSGGTRKWSRPQRDENTYFAGRFRNKLSAPPHRRAGSSYTTPGRVHAEESDAPECPQLMMKCAVR
jgi:hypothetical protein